MKSRPHYLSSAFALFGLILACLSAPVAVSAQTESWTSVGPDGGTAFALAIDPQTPSTIYAGTNGGVFKSTDAGVQWSPTNAGLPGPVGFPENGGPYVHALALDPQNSARIYAGISFRDFFFEPNGRGVFRSDDGGATWTAANAGMSNNELLSLAIAPQTPTTLFAVSRIRTATPGVYKSVDAADNWTLTAFAGFPLVVVIDPQSAVYVGSTAGVYKSTDGGDTWIAMNTGLGSTVVDALAIDPANSAILYAGTRSGGVFKSTDGGASWTPATNGMGAANINALTIVPGNGTLYAGTEANGVFKSVDAGETWTPVASGLAAVSILSLAAEPQAGDSVFAGTNRAGIYASADAGDQWTLTEFSSVRVFSLAADTASPARLFVGDDGGTIYHSEGESEWARVVVEASPVNALAVDPLAPTTVYAALSRAVYKSTDGGASFTNVLLSRPLAIAIDPISPSTVYAGGTGAFKSVDNGMTWTPLSGGLPSGRLNALAIDPQTPTTIYAAVRGIYRSTDGGANWTAMNDGLGSAEMSAIAIDPQSPSTLYAASGGTVFKTVDGGAHWSSSVVASMPIFALALDPRAPSVIFAGTYGAGVFRSSDGAQSWTSINDQLPNLFVRSLLIPPNDPSTLYAGIDGAGVFALADASQFVLTVTSSGRASVTMTSSPSGIECGTDCSNEYAVGAIVTLTATVESGKISGWTGCDSDTGRGRTSTCTVTMDGTRAVSVTTSGRASATAKDTSGPLVQRWDARAEFLHRDERWMARR